MDCHCEERSDEAIQLDRHGALRAPRDDKCPKHEKRWYYKRHASATAGFLSRAQVAISPNVGYVYINPQSAYLL
jgi:hypothetical protein